MKEKEKLLHKIHSINEDYYSVEHSAGGVSFFEYLSQQLVSAGYRLPRSEGMSKRCHHEIEQKPDYPNDYLCQKCQTIWTYQKGMSNAEFIKFPLAVRRLILSEQAEEYVGINIDNYADLED